MYIYGLITLYERHGKQQYLFVNVSMRWDVLWPTLNPILSHSELQDAWEAKHLEVTLVKNKIAYIECWGS
jgi:hypothetical protein